MPKEIADAFGLHPDSLEAIDDDDHVMKTEHCPSCLEWSRKYAELEAKLTESQKDIERYKIQIASLLMTSERNLQ